MKRSTATFLVAVYFCFAIQSAIATEELRNGSPKTALDRYLETPDDSYRWRVIKQGKIGSAEYSLLILTSQVWRDITWKHQLFLIKPKSCKSDCSHGLLTIAGGSWRDELEKAPDELPADAKQFALIAEQLKTPVAVLKQVPNQPIFDGKYEDQIIAFTFEKFVRTGDDSWPLLLPMVKAARRGIDATVEYAKAAWKMDLHTFTTTGASKRGWTTWLSGATDQRVTAIAPMVIDVLNMKQQMDHQKKVWGGFSNQIQDYTDRGLQDLLSTPKGNSLRNIVDPYSYRVRLKQPKLILIGTNDAYWPIDALQHYWNDLENEKYVVYVPNNGHGLNDISRIVGSINGLHMNARGEKPMPKMTWGFEENAGTVSLEIATGEKPDKIQVWSAVSPQRDFRKSKWTSQVLTRNTNGKFRFQMKTPTDGSTAFFGEAIFNRDNFPCYLSTNVKVLEARKTKVD